MKKLTILGIVAALAALGAVFAMSGFIYADAPPQPGQASAGLILTLPGDVAIIVANGGSTADIDTFIEQGSFGTASTAANAANGYGAVAVAGSDSFIQDGGVGSASSSASATSSGLESAAIAIAQSIIGDSEQDGDSDDGGDDGGTPPTPGTPSPIEEPPFSTGTVNSVANSSAANGGVATALATAEILDGGSGSINSYAVANSTGGFALSNTDISVGPGSDTPAAGFYWDAYASGNSMALAVLYVPTTNNIVGFTFSSDASAIVVVQGAQTPFVYAGEVD